MAEQFQLQQINKTNTNIFLIHGMLQGAANALIDKSIESIKQKFKSDVDLTSEFFIFDDTSFDEALACIENLPLFSKRKLVILKHIEGLSREYNNKLISLLDTIKQSTVILVLVGLPDKVLLKKVTAVGLVLDYFRIKIWDISKFVREQFLANGKNVTDRAVEFICIKLGNDTSIIKQEIEKIAAYASSQVVDIKEIEPVVSSNATARIFDLIDAVMAGDISLALRKFVPVCSQERPSFILGMLKRHYRLVARSKGLSADQIEKNLKQHQFVAKKLSQQAKKFDITKMRHVFQILLLAEKDAKYGGDDLFAVQKAIIELSVL